MVFSYHKGEKYWKKEFVYAVTLKENKEKIKEILKDVINIIELDEIRWYKFYKQLEKYENLWYKYVKIEVVKENIYENKRREHQFLFNIK